jgi:hypothetical protein
MPLAMSRPCKHPRSGVYYLRKGVPDDLRQLVGKQEEKRSLKTRDPTEAERRHPEALADVEVRWASPLDDCMDICMDIVTRARRWTCERLGFK